MGQFLRLAESFDAGVRLELISSYLADWVTENVLEWRGYGGVYAMDYSEFLGYVGEALAQEYVVPRLCGGFDLVVRAAGVSRPGSEIDVKVVRGGALVDIEALYPALRGWRPACADLGYGGRGKRRGRVFNIPVYVYEDFKDFTLLRSKGVVERAAEVLKERIRFARLYCLLLNQLYSGLFDFACVSFKEELKRGRLRFTFRKCPKVRIPAYYLPIGVRSGQCSDVGVEEVEARIPEYSVESVKLIEVKATRRSKDEVISEVRKDVRRKARRFVKTVHECGTLNAYLTLITLSRDFRRARVRVYELDLSQL